MASAIVAAGGASVGGGWLADRLGRRAALLAADALFTAGALAMAAAPDTYWLIAGVRLGRAGCRLPPPLRARAPSRRSRSPTCTPPCSARQAAPSWAWAWAWRRWWCRCSSQSVRRPHAAPPW